MTEGVSRQYRKKIGDLDGAYRLANQATRRRWSVRQAQRIMPQQIIGHIDQMAMDTEFIQLSICSSSSSNCRGECLAGGAHSQL
jgi:hypothetical protein